MWTRFELKTRAREAFRRNYWSCVAVAFVIAIITAITSGSAGQNSQESLESIEGTGSIEELAILLSVLIITTITVVIAAIIKIVVGNALLVGGSRFFVVNQIEQARAGELGFGFKCGSFGNILVVMFLRDLFITLWALLLIVPGVIKHYEYLMVPYILAENPQMNRKEVFQISKQMMKGQKMNTFVLDMSFFGWKLLAALTCGILGIFYVEPYYQATMAELYTANKMLAYQNGYIR
ncbi:MAG: DUF975 family protein [Schaedlerella sp.]|nr:DUF975 family protein [Schaedlerella sp.]